MIAVGDMVPLGFHIAMSISLGDRTFNCNDLYAYDSRNSENQNLESAILEKLPVKLQILGGWHSSMGFYWAR